MTINVLHLSDNAPAGGASLHSGRAFRFEREMSILSRNWLKRQGLLVKEEFYTPWGICDLVGVSFSPDRVRQRLRLRQFEPIGPRFRVAILNRIPDAQTGKAISFGRLEREFSNWATPQVLQNEIGNLIETGFVTNSRQDRLQKLNGWVPLHRRIVALELKLWRVEEALNQARSHLRFATHAYVGFPEELALRVARSKRRHDFLNAGVGIVAVTSSQCKVLVPARSGSEETDKVFQMHCVERFWRTRVRGNSP